jgi:hypothetical protein
MVVPTIHGFTVNGIDNDGKNSVVRSFDNLHPVPAGGDYRARLIAQGTKGCLAFSHAPTMEPAIEFGPELAPVGKFAQRQAMLARAVAASLGEAVAMQIAGQQPLLVTALGVISPDA